MKNLAKKLIIGATAVACVLTFAACTPGGNSVDDNQNMQKSAEKQIARAKQTYESFYNKEGGLFSAQPSEKSSVTASAYKAADVALSDGTATFDTVRKTLDKYPVVTTFNLKGTFNSYVADIFSYSQVQTSIIDQFGKSSLTDVYALTYENVLWNSDTTGYGHWINQTRLLSAAFAGTDLDNGNVYCTQSHRSGGVLVLADLEYYYNSDGDMGVTTVNYQSNGKFEYHYCSAGTYEILQAFGSYDAEGNITLTSFTAINQKGIRTASNFEQSDKQVVFGYVQSEVKRISGKIEDLQKQNEREVELDGTEQEEGEHIGVCSVNLDFSKLSQMIIR